MKLKDIILNYNQLTSSEIMDRRLPARLSYAAMKNLRWLEGEARRYEEERVRLCRQLADKDEKGEPLLVENGEGRSSYQLSGENRDTLSKQLEELLEMEVEDQTYKVGAEVFDQWPGGAFDFLTPREMGALDFMIE